MLFPPQGNARAAICYSKTLKGVFKLASATGICFVCMSLSACSGCSPIRTTRNSAPPRTPAASGIRFEDASVAAGLRYRWVIAGKRPLNILQTIGSGCAFLDYNNDGNLDILLVGPKLALYRGDGKGHFTEVTEETGLAKLTGHFLGCAVGDIDGDGYDDIYVTAYRGGVLLHNETRSESDQHSSTLLVQHSITPSLQHSRLFRDITSHSGIKPQPWGTSAAFADIDGDGRLDLYICNYAKFDKSSPQLCDFGGILSSCGPRFYTPETGVLYRNLGDGRFQDVTESWKVTKASGRALGATFADYDGSGRQSLALANDELPGDLFQNVGRSFHNVGATSGTAFGPDGNPHGGMGIDWGDYDNDQKLDLFVATFVHEVKSVYHNDGDGTFADRATNLGIAEKTMPYIAFGAKWFDADNDGWLDLIVANGHVQDNAELIDKSTAYRQPIQLFHNRVGTAMEDTGAAAGEPFRRRIVGRGLAIGDYDNDGKIDALVVDSEGAPLLLHNVSPNAGSWLTIDLRGKRPNVHGIGALVTVEAGGLRMFRRCGTDGSYMSASDRRVHVGLGPATSANIRIKWPGGKITTHAGVRADQIVTLKEQQN